MKNIIFYIICLLSFIIIKVSYLQASDDKKSSSQYLGYTLSIGLESYREDLIVPLGFHGPGLSFLGSHYTYKSDNTIFDNRLKIGLSYVENRFSHFGFTLTPEMRTSWLKKIDIYPEYGKFRIGAALPMKMNNMFIETWDDAHLYWLSTYSLGPAIEWEKPLSENTKQVLRVEVPLFTYVARPPSYRYDKQEALDEVSFHFKETNKNFKTDFFDKYRAFYIQYIFIRDKKDSLSNLGLEFQYDYYSEPEPVRAFKTSLIYSYQWKLRK